CSGAWSMTVFSNGTMAFAPDRPLKNSGSCRYREDTLLYPLSFGIAITISQWGLAPNFDWREGADLGVPPHNLLPRRHGWPTRDAEAR
ncbi:MAG TPA: hypothetical protein VH598_13615, partial [Verrucomicrobiae bacterium]|nr:hypothetical protein [Verrucomicrobiae bacterium]